MSTLLFLTSVSKILEDQLSYGRDLLWHEIGLERAVCGDEALPIESPGDTARGENPFSSVT